jgi:hypothetical protein
MARGLACAAALAEAGLGRFDRALARVDRVVAEQRELGVAGLQLGRSYEIGARIAIGARDSSVFARFAALAAEQYRPGESAVTGPLYERLLDEAGSASSARTMESRRPPTPPRIPSPQG